MLVLTRNVDQEIICVLPSGELMTVKVLSSRGGAARVGLNAPSQVKIFRREIFSDKFEAANQLPSVNN